VIHHPSQWREVRVGGRWLRLRIVRAGKKLQIQDGWSGWRAEASLMDLFAGFSLASLRELLDPIMAAAVAKEQQERRAIAAALKREVKTRDGTTCRWCRREGTVRPDPDGKPWHLDHVVPVVAGGEDTLGNLVLSCALCNVRKHASDWGEPA
jgi:hypothetical protein